MLFMRLIPGRAREAYRWDGLAGLLAGLYAGAVMPFIGFIARDQLHASALQISLLSAAPFMGHLCSLYWANHMQGREKVPYVVYVGVISRGLIALAAVWAGATPFVAIVSAAVIIGAFSLPAYATVMKDIYPDDCRGQCMGLVRMGSTLSTMVGQAIGSRALALVSYRVLFPAAAVFGMFASLSFFRLRRVVPAKDDASIPRTTILDSLAILKHDRFFRHYSLAFFTFGFGNLMNGPLYVLFQVDILHINSYWVGALAMVAAGLSGVCYYLWGRAIDRYSPFAAVLTSFFLWGLVPVTYHFAHALPTLILAAVLTGVAGPGVELTWINAIMQFTDREGIARYSALHFTLVGIRGLLAPLASVTLLRFMDIRQVFLVCFGVVMLGTLMMLAVMVKRKELGVGAAYQ